MNVTNYEKCGLQKMSSHVECVRLKLNFSAKSELFHEKKNSYILWGQKTL